MKPCLLLAALMAGACAALQASEPPIIAKARAYLGTDQALDAVRSIRLTGKMETWYVHDPSVRRTASVDIIFQKPWQEMLKVVVPYLATAKPSDGYVKQTVLDGYDGWELLQMLGPGNKPDFDPERQETLTILGAERVQYLRSDTWEELQYYRGLESIGGWYEDKGPATIDGVACEEVILHHSDKLFFVRYFDQATGRLVYTLTYAGIKVHEDGDIIANGVRFSKTITLDQGDGDKAQHTVITFDQVQLNQNYPESMFETPPPPVMVHPQVAAPVPSAAPDVVPTPAPVQPGGPNVRAPSAQP